MSVVYVCISDSYTCTYISWYVYSQKYMHILTVRFTDDVSRWDSPLVVAGENNTAT